MRLKMIPFIFGITLFTGSSVGQSLRPFKDLVFSQVATGGGYETWITVTNRGSEAYTGSASFFRAMGEPWSPSIDGQTITNGKMSLAVPAGGTRTIKITGGPTTESGFAAFIADNSIQTGFLEGNLTYFVKSGNAISDSVGVTPSSEFYLSTIPFEDFLTVALALVNRSASARVQLSVFSQTNEQVATKTLSLVQNEQWVRFLWEELGRLTVGRGRLEIQSDVPITGTALMFVSGQFSSLPLLPAMRVYTMVTSVFGITCKGQLRLWAEGPYFKGYFLVTEIPGMPTPSFEMLVFGELQDSKLKLLFYAPPTSYGTPEAIGYTTGSLTFSFDQTTLSNSYIVGSYKNNKGNFGSGTFTLTRIN